VPPDQVATVPGPERFGLGVTQRDTVSAAGGVVGAGIAGERWKPVWARLVWPFHRPDTSGMGRPSSRSSRRTPSNPASAGAISTVGTERGSGPGARPAPKKTIGTETSSLLVVPCVVELVPSAQM